MGFLTRLFGRGPQEYLKSLDESINLLRLGVFTYLFKNRYVPKFGKKEGSLWAASVLNTLVLQSPGNEQAKLFYKKNDDAILKEASSICRDPELTGLTGGASYLYAAEILYSTAMTRSPQTDHETKQLHSERIQDLEQQAARLTIWIPNSSHICGSTDVKDCINGIANFAKNFLNRHA